MDAGGNNRNEREREREGERERNEKNKQNKEDEGLYQNENLLSTYSSLNTTANYISKST